MLIVKGLSLALSLAGVFCGPAADSGQRLHGRQPACQVDSRLCSKPGRTSTEPASRRQSGDHPGVLLQQYHILQGLYFCDRSLMVLP